MQRDAAIAFAMAALFAAGEANACSPVPLGETFLTLPGAFEAEVAKVRLVWPEDWEPRFSPVYVAEFKLIGPVRSRIVPTYRWVHNDDCGPSYPVKRGQRVWLLLESDPQGAKRRYAEMMSAVIKEDPTMSSYVDPQDYRPDMAVYPYTDDLGRVQELLELYRPFP